MSIPLQTKIHVNFGYLVKWLGYELWCRVEKAHQDQSTEMGTCGTPLVVTSKARCSSKYKYLHLNTTQNRNLHPEKGWQTICWWGFVQCGWKLWKLSTLSTLGHWLSLFRVLCEEMFSDWNLLASKGKILI